MEHLWTFMTVADPPLPCRASPPQVGRSAIGERPAIVDGADDVRNALPADLPPCGGDVRQDRGGGATPAAAPETKSRQSDDAHTSELLPLLTEMTAEMREQFRFFRELREGAGAALDAAADEAAGKVARADVKAATDAVSLIVRTLEKIDALQRQLARDREAAAEDEADSQSYEDAVTFFHRRIDELVEQKLRARLAHAGVSAGQMAHEAAE